MKRGKKYQDAVKNFDKAAQYDVAEAISLVKKNATAKFDETIELHIRTGCDGRHAEQQIRGAVVLPHGTGKTVKVLVFAKGTKLDEAQAAGADYVGGEYRLDKTNIIHVPVGKASFTEEQLSDNFQTLMGAINKAKPSSLKGQYIKSATITSTMGPGVKLNVVKIAQ